MAIKYITGRDLTLTINSVTYADVASSATFALTAERATIEALSEPKYVQTNKSATLTVDLNQDWGSTSPASVCDALWTAWNTAPNTSLTAVLGANGKTMTFKVFPEPPDFGGGAADALTSTITFIVDMGEAITFA
jgi:hypothetical protein